MRFSLDDGDRGPVARATRDIVISGTSANPVLANIETSVISYQRGTAAVLITGATTVTDTDSPNFNGGKLTVSTTVNPDNSDTYVVRNQGTGVGQFGVTGNVITYQGVTIAGFTGGTGGNTLTITFNSNAATPAVVQALVRNITYSTPANAQPFQKRLTVVVTDGDGGTSNAVPRLINVTS